MFVVVYEKDHRSQSGTTKTQLYSENLMYGLSQNLLSVEQI